MKSPQKKARVVRPGFSCACALCLLRCWLCYGLHWLSSAFLKPETGREEEQRATHESRLPFFPLQLPIP